MIIQISVIRLVYTYRSGRVSKPVKEVYTPTPKGTNPNMARRRGRPPSVPQSISPGGISLINNLFVQFDVCDKLFSGVNRKPDKPHGYFGWGDGC